MNEAEIKTLLDQSPGQRVTEEQIEAKVVRQHFHLFPGTTTIACLLELENGFTVLGKSACADTSNFNPSIGMHFARKDALSKVWELEGYLLRQKMFLNSSN